MIDVTEKARLQFVSLGAGIVRVRVIPGGCSGMTYKAEVDETRLDGDVTVFDEVGLMIVTDKPSLRYLSGLTIDYSDDLIGAGFRFNNPFAAGSCGCGSSFKV